MQPRILIVYTGGTIGMTEDLSTGALVPFQLRSSDEERAEDRASRL